MECARHDQAVSLLSGLDRFIRLVVQRDGFAPSTGSSSPSLTPSYASMYSSRSYMANRPSYTGYRRAQPTSRGAGDTPSNTSSNTTSNNSSYVANASYNNTSAAADMTSSPAIRRYDNTTTNHTTTTTTNNTSPAGGDTTTTTNSSSSIIDNLSTTTTDTLNNVANNNYNYDKRQQQDASSPPPSSTVHGGPGIRDSSTQVAASPSPSSYSPPLNEPGAPPPPRRPLTNEDFQAMIPAHFLTGETVPQTRGLVDSGGIHVAVVQPQQQNLQSSDTAPAHNPMFPPPPTRLGQVTETLTKTTFTETTLTRHTDNRLAQVPLVCEVSYPRTHSKHSNTRVRHFISHLSHSFTRNTSFVPLEFLSLSHSTLSLVRNTLVRSTLLCHS